jgi:hypothetical protein
LGDLDEHGAECSASPKIQNYPRYETCHYKQFLLLGKKLTQVVEFIGGSRQENLKIVKRV